MNSRIFSWIEQLKIWWIWWISTVIIRKELKYVPSKIAVQNTVFQNVILVKSFFIYFSSIFLLLIILFVSNYLAPPNENRIMCRIINAHSLQDETLFVKLVCFRIEILHEIAHYPTVCNSTGTDSSLSNCRPMISQTSRSRHHNIRWYPSIRSDFYSGSNYRFSTDSNQHQLIKCQYSSHSRKMIRSPWVS